MREIPRYDRLLSVLTAAAAWLGENRFPYAVVGGFAAAILGRPRATRDIDIVAGIPLALIEVALHQARSFGFRALDENAVEWAKRHFLVRLEHKESGFPLDVIFASTPFEHDVVNCATTAEVGGTKYRLVLPEHLFAMKVIAARPRDIADCEALIDLQPSLDWSKIEALVCDWAETMERHGCIETMENLKKYAGK